VTRKRVSGNDLGNARKRAPRPASPSSSPTTTAYTQNASYKTTYMADNLHPNDAGYAVLGQSFYNVIASYLTAAPPLLSRDATVEACDSCDGPCRSIDTDVESPVRRRFPWSTTSPG